MKKNISSLSLCLVFCLIVSFSAFASAIPGSHAVHSNTGSSIPSDAGSLLKLSESDKTVQKLLEGSLTAKITDQIILVVDHQLTLWNKSNNGTWQKSMAVYCGYGRNGLKPWNVRKEGDGTTPIGSFPILHAFGFGDNPGTAMDWKTITEHSYWSGEDSSYNTWVESMTPISGEHLIEYNICYKYAMAIGFNRNPIELGRGSAIFLHVKNPATWASSGCVSVEEPVMLQLLGACHNGCYIMIVPDVASISNF